MFLYLIAETMFATGFYMQTTNRLDAALRAFQFLLLHPSQFGFN